jgi:hypothetical protein
MASAVLFDRQPFDRMVRCRTVAKVLLSVIALFDGSPAGLFDGLPAIASGAL